MSNNPLKDSAAKAQQAAGDLADSVAPASGAQPDPEEIKQAATDLGESMMPGLGDAPVPDDVKEAAAKIANSIVPEPNPEQLEEGVMDLAKSALSHIDEAPLPDEVKEAVKKLSESIFPADGSKPDPAKIEEAAKDLAKNALSQAIDELPIPDEAKELAKQALADPSPDALANLAKDALPDEIKDALPDEIKDALPDEVKDALPDEIKDALPDEVTDALPDEVTDALPDAAPDAVADALPDAAPDALPETPAAPAAVAEPPAAAPLAQTEAAPPPAAPSSNGASTPAKGSSSLAKASIINLEKSGSKPIECMFNPKEYSFSKQNQWSKAKTSGKDMPPMEFTSGQPASLQMQLFFDTYADQKDVRVHTGQIWDLMMVDQSLQDPKSKKARPPKVRFQWGKSWTFDAVITSLKQQFTLFLDNGTPVRSTIDITFQQITDMNQLKPQNPTSGGVGGERVWSVSAGDTLPWIAYKCYGDPSLWRQIAAENNLTRVRELVPGEILVIPNV